jgi:type III pantothenate kinase
MREWLGVAIGNSQIHWAYFHDRALITTWNSPHFQHPIDPQDWPNYWQHLPNLLTPCPPLWLASVVLQQTLWFESYPDLHPLTLVDIPVGNLYPTLGIDRALNLYGAGETIGWPVLVIDGGTALTFTGGDSDRRLVGGAILPGCGLQLQSLSQHTASLPLLSLHDRSLTWPDRWSCTTEAAIASGILHTLQSGLQGFVTDWLRQFPTSSIVLTGGDGTLFLQLLQREFTPHTLKLFLIPNLVLQGIEHLHFSYGDDNL